MDPPAGVDLTRARGTEQVVSDDQPSQSGSLHATACITICRNAAPLERLDAVHVMLLEVRLCTASALSAEGMHCRQARASAGAATCSKLPWPDSCGVLPQIVKNKCAAPYKLAEFDILFGSGISNEGCTLDAAEVSAHR